MDDFQLLVDLFKNLPRQGPGGKAETLKALNLSGIDRSQQVKILDIGCGTGASTIVLASELDAHITAVDLLPDFLEILKVKAVSAGLSDKISTVTSSMDTLSFPVESFDMIWSEGAVYIMGFEKGVSSWRRFIKPGGLLVVSEINWLTLKRPSKLQAYWEKEYPEIATASTKLEILEKHGYTPVSYFTLPQYCWIENYYQPMENSFDDFLIRNKKSEQAQAIVDAEKNEIELYKSYNSFYSYGFYIARKCSD